MAEAKKKTAAKKSSPTASQWRQKKGAELTLPSGNVALVRNPGMHHFLRIGVIPNTLRGIVSEAISGGKANFQPKDLLKEEEDLDKIFQMLDDVLVEVVIEPRVKAVPMREVEEGKKIPVPLEDRDQDFIYPDEVDMEDKSFIFQFAVGGTKDLSSFRRQQDQAMDLVRPSSDLEVPTE